MRRKNDKNQKNAAIVFAAVLAGSLMTGCGASSSASSGSTSSGSSNIKYGQVTAVEGSKITLSMGTYSEMTGGPGGTDSGSANAAPAQNGTASGSTA